jgi:hypothetical protein
MFSLRKLKMKPLVRARRGAADFYHDMAQTTRCPPERCASVKRAQEEEGTSCRQLFSTPVGPKQYFQM